MFDWINCYSNERLFVFQIVPNGSAAETNLCVGDRILEVNGMDMREAKHQEAVTALLQNTQRIHLIVRHDPPPRGLQVTIMG